MSDLQRKLMGWAALPVTDRRWAAPLSAVALGFGLFIGVALSPGTSGSLAGNAPQVIEMPALAGTGGSGGGEEAETEAPETGGGFAEESAPAEAGFGGESFTAEAPIALAPTTPETAPEAASGGEHKPAGGGGESEGEEEEPKPKAESPELAGVVVHVNPAASSYTVAEEGGLLTAVHTTKLPAPGLRIEVPIEALANGTVAEEGKRTGKGKTSATSLSGIVTFVDADPADPGYTLSNRGVSLLVHVDPGVGGALPQLPVLGAYASVKVGIEAAPATAPVPGTAAPEPAEATGCVPDPAQAAAAPVAPRGVLRQRTISSGGAPYTSSGFEGILTGVCPESGQLLISADDIRESGADLTFAVPPAIRTTGLEVGESVLVNATIAADGSLALTGLASDELVKGADDTALTQGDLIPEKGGK